MGTVFTQLLSALLSASLHLRPLAGMAALGRLRGVLLNPHSPFLPVAGMSVVAVLGWFGVLLLFAKFSMFDGTEWLAIFVPFLFIMVVLIGMGYALMKADTPSHVS